MQSPLSLAFSGQAGVGLMKASCGPASNLLSILSSRFPASKGRQQLISPLAKGGKGGVAPAREVTHAVPRSLCLKASRLTISGPEAGVVGDSGGFHPPYPPFARGGKDRPS